MTVEAMTVKTDAGLELSAAAKRGKSTATQVQALRGAFDELRRHLEELVAEKKEGSDRGRREALFQGRDLEELEKPGRPLECSAWKVPGFELVPRGEVDEKHAPLLPLVEGKLPAFIHCQRPGEVQHALEIARENGFLARTTLVLGPACWKAADVIAEAGVPVVLTDPLLYVERDPITGEESETFVPGVFRDKGVRFALASPNEQGLWYQAALAVGLGLTREEALAAVTTTPAEILGLGKRVGKLDPGADGNVLLWSGDPLSVTSFVELVVLDGELVYDRSKDVRMKHLLEGLQPAGTAAGSGGEGDQGEEADGDEEPEVEEEDTGDPARTTSPRTSPRTRATRKETSVDPASGSRAPGGGRSRARPRRRRRPEPGAGPRPGGRAQGGHDPPGRGPGRDRRRRDDPRARRAHRRRRRGRPGLPPGTRVVDYGPDAVIAPGLVAANSMVGPGSASERTTDPGTRAVDNFDPHSRAWAYDLAGGVTTLYLPPARGRLIAGQGAVVKLAGEGAARAARVGGAPRHDQGRGARGRRLLGAAGAGHGRRRPGRRAAPAPGLDDGRRAGAARAPGEARAGSDSGEYGPGTPAEVAAHLRAGTPWRMAARTEAEIRALLELARSERPAAGDRGRRRGRRSGARDRRPPASRSWSPSTWPPARPGATSARTATRAGRRIRRAAALSAAGVRLAIATPDNLRARDLRFAAAVASRGGLDEAEALRAITLGAAEMLGVADRVGSIAAGKDADFAVFNGPPLEMTSSVVATWIEGARSSSRRASPPARTPPSAPRRTGRARS